MPCRYEWVSYAGRRHGVPIDLAPGDTCDALCGAAVTIPDVPLSASPDRCAPTCDPCDVAWRKATGIPLWRPVVDVDGAPSHLPADLPTPRTSRPSRVRRAHHSNGAPS